MEPRAAREPVTKAPSRSRTTRIGAATLAPILEGGSMPTLDQELVLVIGGGLLLLAILLIVAVGGFPP